MFQPVTLPDLPLRLTLVIHSLCRTIAARAGRDRALAPIVLLTWPYLMRLAKRFAALVRRIQAGDTAAAPTKPRSASSPRSRKPPLPRGFAWLIRLAPEAAPLGGQLQTLLADPAFSALLEASPQAGRLLRPLCLMLGIEPSPDVPSALFRPPAPRPEPAPLTPEKCASGMSAPTTATAPAADGPPQLSEHRRPDDPAERPLLTSPAKWRDGQ